MFLPLHACNLHCDATHLQAAAVSLCLAGLPYTALQCVVSQKQAEVVMGMHAMRLGSMVLTVSAG